MLTDIVIHATEIPASDCIKIGWQNPMSTSIYLSSRDRSWRDHDNVNIHVTLVTWSHDHVFLPFSCPIGHISTCRRPTSALRGTGGGSCDFRLHSTLRTSGSVWYRRRVVSLSLYGTGGSLWYRCLFMFVFFNELCLYTDLCQTRVDRRYDKTNVKW